MVIMAASAHNLADKRLAGKILGTMELASSVVKVVCPVMGMEADRFCFADIDSIARPGWSLGSGAIPNLAC